VVSVLSKIRDAERDGFTFQTAFRKVPTQPTAANIWFDVSMSPGNPVPNYYIGTSGVFTPLAQSTDGGILHGGNVFPKKKHISLFELQTTTAIITPLQAFVLDYKGFYPFLDESVTDLQLLTNTVPIPRKEKGMQMMPVVVAGQIGGQTFQVTYTNDEGVSDRLTPIHIMGTQAVNGTVISSAGSVPNSIGPFMALQEGDKGVSSVEAIQFMGTGDIGLISLAIVKPVYQQVINNNTAPVETLPIISKSALPIIQDDAYLNIIVLPNGSIQGATILGAIKTTWI
jgi:hypothetical protein